MEIRFAWQISAVRFNTPNLTSITDEAGQKDQPRFSWFVSTSQRSG
ncbi:TPA: hypothetical protein ACGO16_001403 [Streptococcus suis]